MTAFFAIADALDAMTMNRPYHEAAAFDEARQRIVGGRGTQFDPAIVDSFLRVPVRSFVDAAALSGICLREQ